MTRYYETVFRNVRMEKRRIIAPEGWVTVNKHLQTIGTATCDVSNLLLQADEMRSEGNARAAFMLASAARDVLNHRQRCAKHYASRLGQKHIPRR